MASLLVRLCKEKGMVQITILSLELLLLSTCLFSCFLLLKIAIIYRFFLLENALSFIGQLFSSSLHIFFFISIIIVLILVSSRFHHLPKLDDALVFNLILDDAGDSDNNNATTFLENLGNIYDVGDDNHSDGDDDSDTVSLRDIKVDRFRTLSGTSRVGSINLNEFKFCNESQVLDEGLNLLNEYQPSDEGLNENRRLGFDDHDTSMEAMWNAIRLNKSETWPTRAVAEEQLPLPAPEPPSPAARSVCGGGEESSLEATWKELRKSVTFNDAVSASRRAGLARDNVVSTSDEMKKRFDDFISNFNNNLRLQRQESEQRKLLYSLAVN